MDKFRKLGNGIEIPSMGLGCWKAPKSDLTVNAVKYAIEIGYRHIDSAAVYENEVQVGQGIAAGLKSAGIKRSDIFVTSKVWNDMQGYESTLAAYEQTLKDLQLDYLDLYLIHFPNPEKFRDCHVEKNLETWKAMEELYEAGKVRSIGISNFYPRHIDAIKDKIKIKPMVNEIEFRPGCHNQEIRDYCEALGIPIIGYSPLGRGKIFDLKEMEDIAKSCGRTIAQIATRWSMQKGVIPIPKSINPEHIKENLQVWDFELSESEMKAIDNVGGEYCRIFAENPDTMPF